MIKFAKIVSIFFHPLFVAFFNFLFFLLLTNAHGATLGFLITLFFLGCVLIPVFYTFAIVYNDNKHFEWAHLSEMSMLSRKKMLIYTVIYNLVFLLIILFLNPIFLGDYKPMFASVLMSFVFCMILSFIFHLLNIKSSIHALTASFFFTSSLIFVWQIPGLQEIVNSNFKYFLISAIINLIILAALAWARVVLKAHTSREIIYGILIGIISPVLLTLLTFAI